MAESFYSIELALSLNRLCAKNIASTDLQNEAYTFLSSSRTTAIVKEQDYLVYYLDNSL